MRQNGRTMTECDSSHRERRFPRLYRDRHQKGWCSSTVRAAEGPPNDGKNSTMRFAFALIVGLVTIGAAQAQTFADQPSTPRELSTTYLDTSTPSFSRSHAQQYNTANGQ